MKAKQKVKEQPQTTGRLVVVLHCISDANAQTNMRVYRDPPQDLRPRALPRKHATLEGSMQDLGRLGKPPCLPAAKCLFQNPYMGSEPLPEPLREDVFGTIPMT